MSVNTQQRGGEPLGMGTGSAAHIGKRRTVRNQPVDCPSAIEERETRYFEYQPVFREEHKE